MSVKCYYFDINEFFKYPSLHGVILNEGKEVQLLANDFANRSKQFRESELYRFFAERNAVVDPSILEKSGDIFVADTDIPRRDHRKTIEYIESKYHIRVNNILEMNALGGITKYS